GIGAGEGGLCGGLLVQVLQGALDGLDHPRDVTGCDRGRDRGVDLLDRADLGRGDDGNPRGERLADGQSKGLVLAGLKQQIARGELVGYLRGSNPPDVLGVLLRQVIEQLCVVGGQVGATDDAYLNVGSTPGQVPGDGEHGLA